MANRREKYQLSISGRFNTVFKLFLLFGIIAIGVVFTYYTSDVINEMQENEAGMAETYTRIWQLVASDSVSGPVTSVLFDEIILKSNFPIIVTDADENPLFWKKLSGIPDTATSPDIYLRIKERALEMKLAKGEIPIYIDSVVIYRLYYDDPELVNKLRWIPIVEMAMVIGFVVLSVFGFQYIRRTEQKNIWAGMAKETAHQLGTPITSLMGWTAVLKSGESGYTNDEIHRRMEMDLSRLGKIANRFGKIGSRPKLEAVDINQLTEEVVVYFRERLPHGGQGVKIEFNPGDVPPVSVNNDLYIWVVENLIKNGLEAVDSKSGLIKVTTKVVAAGKAVTISVSDNGPGILRRDARRIFRPGFTTKKRGWGLGLSLARRIIHDYHKGSITLQKSDRYGGATFVISLPALPANAVLSETENKEA